MYIINQGPRKNKNSNIEMDIVSLVFNELQWCFNNSIEALEEIFEKRGLNL